MRQIIDFYRADPELVTLFNALYQVGVRSIAEQELCVTLRMSLHELRPRLENMCQAGYLMETPNSTRWLKHYILLRKCASACRSGPDEAGDAEAFRL